jgi:uncharacterized protein (DUF1501 family)
MAAGAQRFSLLERLALASGPAVGYRALVGIFLTGGNDANNMVIPTDPASGYYTTRNTAANLNPFGTSPILPLGTTGAGFHPNLDNLKSRFDAGKLAVVLNVGTLVQPMTMAQYIAVKLGTNTTLKLPEQLFSHADQQNAWTSAIVQPFAKYAGLPSSAEMNTGWGGRLSDKLASVANSANSANPWVTDSNGNTVPFPPFLQYGGPGVFGAGETIDKLSVPGGTLTLSNSAQPAVDAARLAALTDLMSVPSPVAPVDAFTGSFKQALAFATLRNNALSGNPLPVYPTTAGALQTAYNAALTAGGLPTGKSLSAIFPTTSLGGQLLNVLKDIVAGSAAAGNGLGQRRQIFSAAFGTFDTHGNQLVDQGALFTQMDDALNIFYGAILAINNMIAGGLLMPHNTLPIDATIFTQSDFGRTLTPNSSGGSDHGWGSHMLVLGTQVKGGVYGSFPDFTPNLGTPSATAWKGKNDVGEGRWLPAYSADVYANTLANWLGLSQTAAERDYVFPLVKNFGAGTLLGFL